jgi:hypothetical protein
VAVKSWCRVPLTARVLRYTGAAGSQLASAVSALGRRKHNFPLLTDCVRRYSPMRQPSRDLSELESEASTVDVPAEVLEEVSKSVEADFARVIRL